MGMTYKLEQIMNHLNMVWVHLIFQGQRFLSNLIVLFICFCILFSLFFTTPSIAQGLLLTLHYWNTLGSSQGLYVMPEMKGSQVHTREASYPIYYCSGPIYGTLHEFACHSYTGAMLTFFISFLYMFLRILLERRPLPAHSKLIPLEINLLKCKLTSKPIGFAL